MAAGHTRIRKILLMVKTASTFQMGWSKLEKGLFAVLVFLKMRIFIDFNLRFRMLGMDILH